MGRLDRVYAGLPVPLQHAAVTGFGARWYWMRFGPGYRSLVREFGARERFTDAQWKAWQSRAVASLLAHAVEQVPHYRDSWDATARAGARRGELSAVPLLEKDPVRADPTRFVDARLMPSPTLPGLSGPLGRPLVLPTSGSSGTPVSTIWTLSELRASMAIREVRSLNWVGVSFRDPRVTFSGRLVVPTPESDGPFHRWNAIERQAYFSAFHLSPESAPAYADAIRRHRLVWGTGYARSFARLARLLLEQGGPRPHLRAVVVGSEKLDASDRTAIEQAFTCEVRDEYSSVENVMFASECEYRSLHVSPDGGVIEILRPDGSPAGAGEVGEVVVTGLIRRLQPLIRYRIGDLAAWSDAPCACGRPMPVIEEIVGRVEDVLIGADGRRVTRVQGVFYEIPGLLEAQVVQHSTTRFSVKVVVTDRFDDQCSAEIVRRMVERLGSTVQVDVDRVPSIARNPSGKFRAVVSHIER